jgi:hypothetical protein
MAPVMTLPAALLSLDDWADVDYLDDHELTDAERTLLVVYTTARIGHHGRRCWPVGEIYGDG